MIDPRIQSDFATLAGHSFKLGRADAYVGDSDCQVTVVFDPPVEFKLCGDVAPRCTMDATLPAGHLPRATGTYHVLDHECDGWLDPIYDVEPVDPDDPQVVKYRSFYCYGKSYDTESDETESSDIVSIRRIDGSWATYA